MASASTRSSTSTFSSSKWFFSSSFSSISIASLSSIMVVSFTVSVQIASSPSSISGLSFTPTNSSSSCCTSCFCNSKSAMCSISLESFSCCWIMSASVWSTSIVSFSIWSCSLFSCKASVALASSKPCFSISRKTSASGDSWELSKGIISSSQLSFLSWTFASTSCSFTVSSSSALLFSAVVAWASVLIVSFSPSSFSSFWFCSFLAFSEISPSLVSSSEGFSGSWPFCWALYEMVSLRSEFLCSKTISSSTSSCESCLSSSWLTWFSFSCWISCSSKSFSSAVSSFSFLFAPVLWSCSFSSVLFSLVSTLKHSNKASRASLSSCIFLIALATPWHCKMRSASK